MSEAFGFKVEADTHAWIGDSGPPEYDDFYGEKWTVYLPHQCGDWIIGPDYNGRMDSGDAITALKSFIDEAQETLRVLEEEAPETAPSGGWGWTKEQGSTT